MPLRTALPEKLHTGDLIQTEGLRIYERDSRDAAGPMNGDMALPASAPAHLLTHDMGASIADGDWDDLFNAVQDQLTHIVSGGDSGAPTASELSSAHVRECVLDCVAALRLLQDSVTSGRQRREGLELAVFEAQTSLAQVRTALVGTQRGERRARQDVLHDSLTRLPNREFLLDRIRRQLVRGGETRRILAVMFFDLDELKRVNDNPAHTADGELLRIIAARLRRAVHSRDVVGRVGGDKFACIVGGVQDSAQLAHFAGKLAQAIAAPCTVAGLKRVVHASIGIATFPEAGSSAEELLKSAELAMYAAKRQRVRHAFFSLDDAGATAAPQDPESPHQPLPQS